MDTKTAKIARINGQVQEYAFGDGETVADLLAAANETLKKGETITLDGDVVETDYEFESGDEFIIVANVTGA